MPKVKDARQAEKIVCSHYPILAQPHDFETHQQDDTWVVIFKVFTTTWALEHEWHIDANTGNVNKVK